MTQYKYKSHPRGQVNIFYRFLGDFNEKTRRKPVPNRRSYKNSGRRFGKTKLPNCPYPAGDEKTSLTATEWYQKIDALLKKMDSRANQLKKEQLIKALAQLRK